MNSINNAQHKEHKMTTNYFDNSKQELPSVNDFQDMSTPRSSLRSHLRSVKRALRLNRNKSKALALPEAQIPQPAIDYSELEVQAGPLHKASIDVQGEMILRPAQSLLGLTVVSHSGSEDLGEVHDLIFSNETDEVLALMLEQPSGAPLSDVQIVPWSEICNIGKEKIVVCRAVSKMRLGDYARALKAATDSKNRLSGIQVLKSEGQYLPMPDDICIDEVSGSIIGYDSSNGFIDDSLSDKKILPAPLDLSVRNR
jgi:uncharacterized protein YrrD